MKHAILCDTFPFMTNALLSFTCRTNGSEHLQNQNAAETFHHISALKWQRRTERVCSESSECVCYALSSGLWMSRSWNKYLNRKHTKRKPKQKRGKIAQILRKEKKKRLTALLVMNFESIVMLHTLTDFQQFLRSNRYTTSECARIFRSAHALLFRLIRLLSVWIVSFVATACKRKEHKQSNQNRLGAINSFSTK